jgi:hypothetical protein
MPTQRQLMGTGLSGPTARAIAGGGAALASAGTGSIAAATLLPTETVNLSAAASLDAYLLPSTAQGSAIGDKITVWASSSTSAVVYAGTGETSNNSATVTVAQYKMCIFTRISATQWGHIITP